ncbi:hypothetical protein EXS57_03645 [Candidatus Kaiserbacteria bacterium]|nr:hypothetical protein [Candidatus Kaiserbacteria bacterium]
MTIDVDEADRGDVVERGMGVGFIPHNLDLASWNEGLTKFPFNVLFVAHSMKDGKKVSGSAVYEPEFSTFIKDDEMKMSCMHYRNIYNKTDTECRLMIAYNAENGGYCGGKYVNGEQVGVAVGPNWKTFFFHLTMLGLAKDEPCKFE